MTLEEIRTTIAANKAVLAGRFKVREIGVFGSHSRGEQTEGSDVDLLVDFYEPVGFFQFLDLEEYLEDVLEHKVDLVSRKALKPRIGQNILSELITL